MSATALWQYNHAGTGPTERNDQNNNLKAGKNLVAQRRTFCGAGAWVDLVSLFMEEEAKKRGYLNSVALVTHFSFLHFNILD